MATNLNLSPTQIAECWECYSINKDVSELTDHSFPAFRLALIKDSDNVDMDVVKEMGKGAVVSRPSLGEKRQGVTTADDGSIPSVTPPAKRSGVTFDKTPVASSGDWGGDRLSISRRISLSPAPPGALLDSRTVKLPRYGERQAAGKVVSEFDPNKLDTSVELPSTTTAPRCTISQEFETNVKKRYRHMFTTLEERSKALDDHMVELGDVMVKRYGLGKHEDDEEDNETGIAGLENVGVPRQDKICCIGRICNEVRHRNTLYTSFLLPRVSSVLQRLFSYFVVSSFVLIAYRLMRVASMRRRFCSKDLAWGRVEKELNWIWGISKLQRLPTRCFQERWSLSKE